MLELEPIKRFIDVVGKEIEKYFGKEEGCIVYLQPDGTFYGFALYEWLKARGKNMTITTMEDDGRGLEENKARGRKVLIVDNDVVTGKGYKRSMEALRIRKKELKLKDIKFATSYDRVGVADFSVGKYSTETIWNLADLDAIDLKIIQTLSVNGRESFADIGKKINLSSVAVKNRVDKLLKERVIRIEAVFNMDQFYALCAQIYVEADPKAVEKMIEKFEKMQEVYHLVRVTGIYNLLIGIGGQSRQKIYEFIEQEVRSNPGVRKIFITTGETPILPKTISLATS